jgi:predicted metal-dependent hydrolase
MKQRTGAERPPDSLDTGQLVLEPRDVHFDWSGLPLRWIPGEPQASHIINVLHLLLPEGERWFVATFKQALPLITDDSLREDVIGFIGQEAIHAEAHQGVLDYFRERGLDTTPYVRHMEWLFRHILGTRTGLTPAQAREQLIEHVGIVAGIEHFTAFLGHWVLNAGGLDRARAHPVMLDLLRWHGAEEVEHRCVAFDLLVHLDPRYARRVRSMATAVLLLLWLWIRGARFLMAADPELGPRAKASWRGYAAGARRGILPAPRAAARSAARYLRRGYHPTQEAWTRQAIAYLGSSPAARAAAR